MSIKSPVSSFSEPTLVPSDPTLSQTTDASGTISVSTVFQYDDADLIILSSDYVFFSVHARTLRVASSVLGQLIDVLSESNSYRPSPASTSVPCTPFDEQKRFMPLPTPVSPPPSPTLGRRAAQLGEPIIVPLSEPADVLNVILHLLYQMPCAHFYPSLQTLQAVLSALRSYDIPLLPGSFLSHSISSLISLHAPQEPLYAYALAASANLEPLAVLASRFCLHTRLSDVTEPLALLMGPLYLRRLLFLHLGRVEALKRILAPLPLVHSPTTSHDSDCDVADQKQITRAWVLGTAYLAWGARPDLTEHEVREVLEKIEEKLKCESCRTGVEEHIEQLCRGWAAIKDTI